jgi:hypothetical protein
VTDSASYISDWLEELPRLARRFHLVLTTIGHAHQPIRATIGSISDQVMSVADYLSVSPLSEGHKLVVLTDLETVCLDAIASRNLSVLRERIYADMDSGADFVLVSRFPRVRYPAVPGSSLLEDSKMVFAPLASDVEGRTSDPSASILPVDVESENSDLEITFRAIFDELGVAVMASLDHATFEAMVPRGEVFSLLSRRDREALHGAGLARVENGAYVWSMPTLYGELRESLSNALAELTETQESLSEVFSVLWSLERSIRMVMRDRAREVWGKHWRQQALHGDLPAKVLDRATGDAYAAAKSLKEIRDPFEWLSLGELLEVRQREHFGGLGVQEVVWKKFAAEVLPVRNRLSHMRLLHEGDLLIVRLWSEVLGRKLKA